MRSSHRLLFYLTIAAATASIYYRRCIRHNEYLIPGYHGIFSRKRWFVILACPFRGPGPLQWRRASSSCTGCTHPVSSRRIRCWHTVDHLFGWDTFRRVSVSFDFHVPALPGSSGAHHDVCLEKSVPTAPISSSVINKTCRSLMVKGVVGWTNGFVSSQHDVVAPLSGTQSKPL
jgi:hypothetical protein